MVEYKRIFEWRQNNMADSDPQSLDSFQIKLLKTFDMHKYSESKNNIGQIYQSTRKELETAHVKPLRAALGFHRFAERRKLFTCFSLCAI